MFVVVTEILLAVLGVVMSDSKLGAHPQRTWLPNNRQSSLPFVGGTWAGRRAGGDPFPHFRAVDGNAFVSLKAQYDSGAVDREHRDFEHGLGAVDAAYDD
jgi:hypothetical protein